MTSNELYTQCSKLVASINFEDLVDQKVIETITNGELTQANDNGTSYGLPQLIVYTALAQYLKQFRITIPNQLLALHDRVPVI